MHCMKKGNVHHHCRSVFYTKINVTLNIILIINVNHKNILEFSKIVTVYTCIYVFTRYDTDENLNKFTKRITIFSQ